MSDRVLIIAEAGVNHNGSQELALRLVEEAANAGADVVKFQTFSADRLATRTAPKAEYQLRTTSASESQWEMLKRLELSPAAHQALQTRARERGIEFLSTPFDLESVDLLLRLGVGRLKLGSGEVTNAPLLVHAARTGKDILLSTGMSTLAEVELALSALAFGYTSPKATPGIDAFRQAYASEAGKDALRRKVTLLHCTTEYPAAFEDVNLRAMDTLRETFGLRVGFSDHTPGMVASVAAVARGASVVEKHLTLDRTMDGPDHKASLEPSEFRELVDSIRRAAQCLGSGVKQPAQGEKSNIAVARKGLAAAAAVAAGEAFTPQNLAVKRVGGGVSPFEYWDRLGTRARRDYKADEPID